MVNLYWWTKLASLDCIWNSCCTSCLYDNEYLKTNIPLHYNKHSTSAQQALQQNPLQFLTNVSVLYKQLITKVPSDIFMFLKRTPWHTEMSIVSWGTSQYIWWLTQCDRLQASALSANMSLYIYQKTSQVLDGKGNVQWLWCGSHTEGKMILS